MSGLLSKISSTLDQFGHDGRTSQVWTALTIRALNSLHAEGDSASTLASKESEVSSGSSRADKVISTVLLHLGPIIKSSYIELLSADLTELVNLSIEVWNNAQSGGLRMSINSALEFRHREEWRAAQFDPVPSEGERDLTQVSMTYPRIFTLFPQVMARLPDAAPMPGSFPELEPKVIHHGVGLPEGSPLVLRGKKDAEDRKIAISNFKKELNSNRRGSVHTHTRQESRGSVNSLATTLLSQ